MDFFDYILPFVDENKSAILFGTFVTFITFIGKSQYKRHSALPPGPWGLPFLGCLPWLKRGDQHAYMVRLAHNYGELCSVRLGSRLAVCVSCPKLLRQLFSRSDKFVYRPDTPLNNILRGYGIVLSEGNLYKAQKMFLMDKLRTLGITTKQDKECSPAERLIMMEVEELLNSLVQHQHEYIDPTSLFGLHVHNVICQITMSFRFEENDESYERFNNLVSEGMRLYGEVHLAEYLPIFLLLPSKRTVLDAIRRNHEEMSQFHRDHVNARLEQRRTRPPYQPPADLLDCYLDAMHEIEHYNARNIFCNVDKIQQLLQVMNDLFSAGMETVRSALAWLVVVMLRWPHVADRVRRELAAVIGGPGALVTLAHKDSLPYTEAVILETLRRVNVVPLGTTHSNALETMAGDYTIPKRSLVIPLLSKIHMDPALFPNPEEFLPERFIKDDRVIQLENFMPFGTGRRVCLGEVLAKKELFLFFANIMNAYDFSLADGVQPPPLVGSCGVTHSPLPYRVRFTRRR